MQFKSDEQRRAVFWKLKHKGGGGGQPPKPPKPNPSGTTLWDILGIPDPTQFTPLPPGPGIPGNPGGSWTGTGGAIYNNPASNWFINPPSAPNFGSYNGPGVGPYQAPVFQQFEPAETLWGSLYDIANGVDPNTGAALAPYGAPGTLVGSIGLDAANKQIDLKAEQNNPAYFGGTGQLSSAYWDKLAYRNKKKRPWFLP